MKSYVWSSSMRVLEERGEQVLLFNGINARFWVPRALFQCLRAFERPATVGSVLQQPGIPGGLAAQIEELRRYLFLVPARVNHRDDMRSTWNCLAQGTAADVAYAIDNETPGMQEFQQAGVEAVDALGLLVDIKPAWHVLNIGCGMGRLERFLAGRVSRIVGVDVSDAMLERARDYLAECGNVELLRADADLVMLPSRSFDLVVSFLVFQHCPKEVTWSYLREAARVLKQGGQFIFQILCYADDAGYASGETSPVERYYGRGKPRYREEEVRREIEAAGLRLEMFRDGDHTGIERRLTGTSAPHWTSKLVRAAL